MADKDYLNYRKGQDANYENTVQDAVEHLLSVFFKAEHDPIKMVAKLCTVYEMTEELGLSQEQLEQFIKMGGQDACKKKVH
tara:strand:+ start:319 stop:561 length:243 start_codon:yes stop_codon:yes gene_type:complete